MTPLTTQQDPAVVFLLKEDRTVTMTPTFRGRERGGEAGFALILAILALMLLTFLGLTLATTTSTELQIATNYRWGQQALYNAQAGLEAAKVILSNPPVADPSGLTVLPQVRTAGSPWALNATVPVLDPPGPTRDYENAGCDRRGGLSMGYGRVLVDGAGAYQNVSSFGGEQLNGTFTIWVRRGLLVNNAGQFSDSAVNSTAVVTVEGTAPFLFVDADGDGISDNAAFAQANQATRLLETTVTLSTGAGITSCAGLEGQTGMAPQGDNFGCALLDDSSVNVLRNP